MLTPNAIKICDMVGGYINCDKCPLLKICEETPKKVSEWEAKMEEAATAYLKNQKEITQ